MVTARRNGRLRFLRGARDGENDVRTKNKRFLIRLIVTSLTILAALTGSHSAAAQGADAYRGGTKAIGRVAEVYLRGGDNVFLAPNQVPQHLRKSAELWVDVELADLRANGIEPARVFLKRNQAAVKAGDAVEIQFAHRQNPRYFPLQEATRVTKFVHTGNEALARGYGHRAAGGDAPGDLPAFWLDRPRAHTTSSSIPPAAAAGTAR